MESLNEVVPLHLRNAVTSLDRSIGYCKEYKYAHDFEDHFAVQEHLPHNLAGRRYYEPTGEGAEEAMADRLRRLRERDGK